VNSTGCGEPELPVETWPKRKNVFNDGTTATLIVLPELWLTVIGWIGGTPYVFQYGVTVPVPVIAVLRRMRTWM
jgi:hypothetical protein